MIGVWYIHSFFELTKLYNILLRFNENHWKYPPSFSSSSLLQEMKIPLNALFKIKTVAFLLSGQLYIKVVDHVIQVLYRPQCTVT